MMMQNMPYVISVSPKDDYRLSITFDDGVTKELSIEPFIKNGVSAVLRDKDYFKLVTAENGYVTWPNGFDLCPEFLRNHI